MCSAVRGSTRLHSLLCPLGRSGKSKNPPTHSCSQITSLCVRESLFMLIRIICTCLSQRHLWTQTSSSARSVRPGLIFFVLIRSIKKITKRSKCQRLNKLFIDTNFSGSASVRPTRRPSHLADADLSSDPTGPPGGLQSTDVPAAFRDQHRHVSLVLPH